MRPALQRLEVFATLEIVENETTALSTHVLPTKDQLERPDIALWDFLSPRVNAQYTRAAVRPVGERRATWWVLAELMRRLGLETPGSVPTDGEASGADDAMLATLVENARCTFAELTERGYVETGHEFPARWVDAHIERLGGWRLAPAPLVEQLKTLGRTHLAAAGEPAALNLTPRRQRRHLNAQYLFLGDVFDVLLHPTDAANAGVKDGQPVTVTHRERRSRGYGARGRACATRCHFCSARSRAPQRQSADQHSRSRSADGHGAVLGDTGERPPAPRLRLGPSRDSHADSRPLPASRGRVQLPRCRRPCNGGWPHGALGTGVSSRCASLLHAGRCRTAGESRRACHL